MRTDDVQTGDPNRPARPPSRRRRLAAGVALVALVASGLAVHALLPDTAATDIAGDALYAVAIYAVVVLLAPRLGAAAAGAIAAGWCIAVELFQLTGIPAELGAVFPPAMLVLGTVFDARDLVVYPLAVVGAAAIDAAVSAARSSRTVR
ncbi:DUF2809 domain-containing protein [Agromyces sp. LHK192]|uniref:DUF2809 domain-containing protein n=1 Tax=Agromyces sp. LHK192 TaxID=2498704 RepID=UPI000FDB4A0A|nr:DUF2809 domain-containing protein [Agromyces sp. LHK192]